MSFARKMRRKGHVVTRQAFGWYDVATLEEATRIEDAVRDGIARVGGIVEKVKMFSKPNGTRDVMVWGFRRDGWTRHAVEGMKVQVGRSLRGGA